MTEPIDNDFSGQKREAQPTLPFDPAQVDRCGIRLTRAEFARFLNVSKQSISKWVAAGKIVLGADGRLDPRQAVAQLLRNSDPAKLRAKALAPLVRDVGELQRRIAELEAELARVIEDRDFQAGAADELLRAPDALLYLIAEEWSALRTVEPDGIAAALDDLFRRATDLAAREIDELIPGIHAVTRAELAEMENWCRESAESIAHEGIGALRAAHEKKGEGGAA
jgi:DNA-binding transcriptional regulator YiaG